MIEIAEAETRDLAVRKTAMSPVLSALSVQALQLGEHQSAVCIETLG
jgi:hypothetical protein